jgi:hypothetical protein
MEKFITLPRKTASCKLASATRAVWSFQSRGGALYEREVPVADMVEAFVGTVGMKLKIRLSDSAHFVTIVNTATLKTGYRVYFS